MKDKKDNTGMGNSGYRNSGDRNSGNCNSGDYNSGDYNSGDYNSGNCNSGYFNTDEPTVRLFNKDTSMKRSEVDIPFIYLTITEWVPKSKMTTEQKKADPNFHIKGGTLVKRTYHEAWAKAWDEMDKETQQKFLDLPNFDAAIFKEITGIDVPPRDGKVVEIDGKKYRLSEVKES